MALLKAFLAFTLLSFLLLGSCNAIDDDKRVFEKREVLPFDWMESHEPDPTLILTVRIGLKQENIDHLEEFLTSVSHPDSSQYGQHWTPQQVAKVFAPATDTINAVKGWLVDAGIAPAKIELTRSQGWIHFNATVGEVEELLGSKYKVYRHGSGIEHIGELH